MYELTSSRRAFLGASLPALGNTAETLAGEGKSPRPVRVVCVGAHPDDPESGCGGTLARYSAAGHAVSVIYLTRGERGLAGKSLDEAAAIRSAQAAAACKVLGAKPVFAGQIDGATEFNRERIGSFNRLIEAEAPDIVFTQWPLDTHPDHQVASMLTVRAYFAARARFHLYFYEVDCGAQTQGFHPTRYVDISSVREKKRAALFQHTDGKQIYSEHHEAMENFRGREARVACAEAFVHFSSDQSVFRPPLL